MTDKCGNPTVSDRLSGLGLSDTLKREKAAAKKIKRRAKTKGSGDTEAPVVSDRQANDTGLSAATEQNGGSGVSPHKVTPDPTLTGGETHSVMIARLYRAFAGQMDQLDVRLKDLLPDRSAGVVEIDRTVKTLASLAKTLTVLMDLKSGEDHIAEESSLDDPEGLRAELAQRLERLCEGGAH